MRFWWCLSVLGVVVPGQQSSPMGVQDRITGLRAELAARERTRGPDHVETAQILDELGYALVRVGAYAEGEQLCRRALRIREQTLGPTHVETGTCLVHLAVALRAQGKYGEAETHCRRALGFWEQAFGAEHPDTGRCLGLLASLLQEQGRLAEAEPLAQRTVAILAKGLGVGNPETAASLNNLGLLLKAMGRLEPARLCLLQAFEVLRAALGEDHTEVAAVLHNLAVVLLAQGKVAAAEPFCRQALAIWEKARGPEHRDVAACLGTLGSILEPQGKVAEAEALNYRAWQIKEATLGKTHHATAVSLNNLARCIQAQGRVAEAERRFREAQEVLEKNAGPGHPDTAAVVNNLALLLQSQGRPAEAEPLCRRGLEFRERILGSEHPDTAVSLNNLALVLQAQGRPAEAEPLFRRALSIQEAALGLEHPAAIASLMNLTLLLHRQGRRAEACTQALRLVDASLGHAAAELPLTPTEDRFQVSARIEAALELLLSTADPASPSAQDALFTRLASWKGLAFRVALRSRDRLVGELAPTPRALVARVTDLKGELSHLAYARDVKDRAAHTRRLAELQEEQRRAEAQLLRGLGLDREQVRATASQLADQLPQDAAFVDLSVLRRCLPARVEQGRVVEPTRWEAPRVHAWIVRAGDTSVRHLDLGLATDLETATVAFLAELEAQRGESLGSNDTRPSPNDRLRAALWEPLAKALGDARLVFVCPDRFLARLPLETLEVGSGRFLIEERQFVYVEDAVTLLGLLRSPPAARAAIPSLLGVGGVDYEERGAVEGPARTLPAEGLRGGWIRNWDPLSQTRPEAEGIAVQLRKRFGQDAVALVLTDAQASEERIKAEAPKFSILHLATHGYFEPTGVPSLWEEARKTAQAGEGRPQAPGGERPGSRPAGYPPGLLSGLVLAGANAKAEPGRDDGYLTAEEVDALPLKACDLVVLSACETGLGTARGGEGMLSVRRAFREAGAKTVVSSLWRVRDESTRKLMGEFYRRMWTDRESPAAALRGAQLWLLADNRRRNASAPRPSTWGAFVLSGEWR